MKCPKCNAEFETVEFGGIEVERCTGCKGLWFDSLEHQQLKNLEGSEVIDSGDPDKGREFNAKDRYSCPKCSARMIRMVDNAQPHIWFESCSSCNGVFFDAGEFTDLKEHTLTDHLKSFLARVKGGR